MLGYLIAAQALSLSERNFLGRCGGNLEIEIDNNRKEIAPGGSDKISGKIVLDIENSLGLTMPLIRFKLKGGKMPLGYGIHGGSIRSGPVDNARLYGGSCEIRVNKNTGIVLDPEKNTEISGFAIVKTENELEYTNLWIQLEGIAIAKFQSKFDGAMTKHFTSEFILPPRLAHFAFGQKDFARCSKKTLKPGRHCFPFKIDLLPITYPTSFKSAFGQIQYRLAVYVNQDFFAEQKYPAVLQSLTCRGYKNFRNQEELLFPIEVVRTKEKYFSKRLLAKATFNVGKQGYMCGEVLSFSLVVENSMCERITRMSVELVNKVIYYGVNQAATKTTSVVLRKLERTEETSDGEIVWTGEFNIPANLMPSFATNSKCLDITYFLQFMVETNRRPLLKGDALIIIGSTDGVSKARTSSKPTEDGDAISLPPTYSTLSSRRSSIETLPPTYDDAVRFEMEDIAEEDPFDFRPRSSSNTM